MRWSNSRLATLGFRSALSCEGLSRLGSTDLTDLVLLAGGSVIMTHHVTGTYFMCNDWHDGVGNHT
ncbi:predicted protein [Streptomyces viridochromogenes DSM 40736]|uniref:Predicted protein n=1 Tax=Streptomyces viridochromogenes (strain DSM 40736 / JCM 4977 / BCRC 1201 / Tue 494) TaxID=591159 RepID=D9X1V9_STRVT|nr:predicted protein [Streptomyces viridochromogenes DSM 40736]